MYFLAFDATCRRFDLTVLDVNPQTTTGKTARQQLQLEFAKLSSVKSLSGVPRQVSRFGEIDEGGISPEKRMSSNFLTVPVTRATTQSEPFYYPRRPVAPLLKIGPAATGKKWGIERHDKWFTSLLRLCDHIPFPTQMFDLAIFVCRNMRIEDDGASLLDGIRVSLRERFTEEVSSHWIHRIEKEKLIFPAFSSPLLDVFSPWETGYLGKSGREGEYKKMSKDELIERIGELETMLERSGVEY